MRILLLDPNDSPRSGPWSLQRWDLVIDLGKSSQASAQEWSKQYGCPVIRADSYREKVEDVRRVRDILSIGRGRLIDEEGIDWWENTCLLLAPEALELVAIRRVTKLIPRSAEVWATRRGTTTHLFQILLEGELRFFDETRLRRFIAGASHYAGVARYFSPSQITEIFFDKYDPAYRWRARFARRQLASQETVVLVPTAYRNVSRMAAAYARVLPKQKFLMVVTRKNARELSVPENVGIRDLAEYGDSPVPDREISLLIERWSIFKDDITGFPELSVLAEVGVLNSISDWIHDGLCVRDAWRQVLQREPVRAVVCGDDSNRYTRLPVLLAAKRNIPTLDFHHGALDGSYLMKDLPSDLYLAKNEMERDYQVRVCGLPADRVVVGAPAQQSLGPTRARDAKEAKAVVLFSEPYDVLGMRSTEVYRELLPPLCQLAREYDREVIVKLHPFESRSERSHLLREVLPSDDYRLIRIVDGPLTQELMASAWFGITVESTTVLDCLQNGVLCFLCGWLTLSLYGYPEQYSRFGVGEALESVEQIPGIPARIEEFRIRQANRDAFWEPANPVQLEQWLACGCTEQRSDARAIS